MPVPSYLILELLDRTLRDSIRTRRLIGLPMLGAFPKDSILEYHNYVEESKSIATKQLSNSILRFCQQKKEGLPYIINFISTEGGEGKSYVIEALKKYWNSIGLKTKVITWKSDFRIDSREYNLAKSITHQRKKIFSSLNIPICGKLAYRWNYYKKLI